MFHALLFPSHCSHVYLLQSEVFILRVQCWHGCLHVYFSEFLIWDFFFFLHFANPDNFPFPISAENISETPHPHEQDIFLKSESETSHYFILSPLGEIGLEIE